MSPAARDAGGVLLLYRRPISRWFRDAATIDDHIAAFSRFSRHAVHSHNTELGYPHGLDDARFDAVVMHYSLFGGGAAEYPFPHRFEQLLDRTPDAYKVAFFHDEHTHCGQRFAFLNRHDFDCVFTLLEEEQFDAVYGAYTEVPTLASHLPGYVSDSLLEAERFATADPRRATDVGFRARPLAPFMGPDEKTDIGRGFAERAAGTGLVTDIEVSDESLLPGDEWFRFIASAHTMLGVESGTRTFDLEDEVLGEYSRLAAERGADNVSLDDLSPEVLARWTDRVPYRTIGPRHFEAAGLGVCQVLFEGSYSGLMEPMTHYIPLRKDFSNFDEVVERIRDDGLRRELAANAHRDLVASGEHTYAGLISQLDEVLTDAGIEPGRTGPAGSAIAERALHRGPAAIALQRTRSWLSYNPVASKLLWRISRPVLAGWRRLQRTLPARRP